MTKQIITCRQCGKEFTKESNKGLRINCSKRCYDLSRNVYKGKEYFRNYNKNRALVSDGHKVKMPKPAPSPSYDWDMINRLGTGKSSRD